MSRRAPWWLACPQRRANDLSKGDLTYLGKKIRLLAFLTARIPRHGWRQWLRGVRERKLGYTAMELAHTLPSRAAVIVDVGGHRGDVAAALDFLYAPRRLWVVEPNPALTAGLQKRFAQQSHITIVPRCLGEGEGEVSFHVHEFDAASSLFECQPGHLEKFGFSGQSRLVSVPMTTLVRLLAGAATPVIDLLKLDCQGGELAVLRGAGVRLCDVRHIYCEVAFDPIYAGAPLFGEVHRFLIGSGFALVSLGEFAGTGDSIQWGDALYRNNRPLA